jgi:hypothetical protein
MKSISFRIGVRRHVTPLITRGKGGQEVIALGLGCLLLVVDSVSVNWLPAATCNLIWSLPPCWSFQDAVERSYRKWSLRMWHSVIWEVGTDTLEEPSSQLTVEVPCSSKIWAPMSQNTCCHFPQNCNLNANEVHIMNYIWKDENKYGSGKEKVHTVDDNKMDFR